MLKNKPIYKFVMLSLFLSLGVSVTTFAENIAKEIPGKVDLISIKKIYYEKDYPSVIKLGENYLNQYPADVDVKLFIGLSYYQLKQYGKAGNYFKEILLKYPDYKEARMGLIRNYLAEKKINEAINSINTGLEQNNNDADYLTLKTRCLLLKKQNSNALVTVNHLLSVKPSSKEGIELKKNITFIINNERKINKASIQKKKKIKLLSIKNSKPKQEKKIRDKPHFVIGAYASNMDVNRPDQIWNISSIYLYRKNEYGAFGGAINRTRRNSRDAAQGYINFQPKLGDNLWFDLGYGKANNPNLFPDDLWLGEVFAKLTKAIIISGGANYKKIARTNLNTMTGSISTYLGYYYLSIRPIHFVPKAGPKSTLYQVKARKYYDNPDKYIGFVLSSGTSPDLFDLLTVSFFKVKDNIFLFEGQQPVNDMLAFQYGTGYETQKFPNGFKRKFLYLNVGIKVRAA
jgi:YaiO family outer membrane protein